MPLHMLCIQWLFCSTLLHAYSKQIAQTKLNSTLWEGRDVVLMLSREDAVHAQQIAQSQLDVFVELFVQ